MPLPDRMVVLSASPPPGASLAVQKVRVAGTLFLWRRLDVHDRRVTKRFQDFTSVDHVILILQNRFAFFSRSGC